MINFGISTGVCREKEGEPLSVYLHLGPLGIVSCSADIARMIATQLILNADLVEGRRQEGEEEGE